MTRDPNADAPDPVLSYAELEREKERFRELSDAAFEGLAIHDNGIIVDCNQALAKMLGYEVSDLVGQSALMFGAPETHALVLERIKSDSREPYEALGLRKDGSKFAAEVRGAPIHYQGRMLRVTAIRDISEQKKLEAQFRVSEQMISMGSVAAGVAHEINNPLTYVLGNLQILARHLASLEPELDRAKAETMKKCIDEALDGTERVRAIVRDLRGFTRPSDQERAVVDLRQVLETSVRIVGNEVRHKARLVRDYQDLPLIDANELRLAQVFVNLLVNAAQAMEEGAAAQNEIRLRTHADERGWAVVEIHDTGRGIPAELRERVFEPFFTTKPGRGTGLGLSISRTIVDDLNGEIRIGNAARGTVFRLAFPPARRASVTTPAPQVVAPPAPQSVLIVDDEPRVGLMLKRLLDRDYTVTTVTNIADAQKLFAEGRAFDAILCDLMMPDGTGMDLHARLRQQGSPMAERMLFVTGGAFTPAAEEFLKRPDIRHLEKPITFDQLRQALASLRS
ncbi:MAG TPA: ATP-binding protein [Polyangia bacterium]|nr:ATP-binding protein [Polyangia bacterium]